MPVPRAWLPIVAAATALLVAGCTTIAAGTAISTTAPPTHAQLDQIMLPINELKAIVGARNMALTSRSTTLDNNFWWVREPKCVGALYPAEMRVYRFTNWREIRTEVAQDADSDHQHWVQQAAVRHASEDDAQSTRRIFTKWWGQCAGSAVSIGTSAGGNTSDRTWNIGALDTEGDNVISQTSTRAGTDGWTCQHALAAVSTVVLESKVCGYQVRDQAVTIVNRLSANAR
ncbi:hypothetical protein B7435_16925 [Mycolicibacterium peregrinum]|uniref:Sensor domain-containing protein n=1 Tax=Mycolicibacterium alvei TaxID=67081 RepID=A0A6N4V2U0_9MYCO|nr:MULTISPECIES: sensor domain-containing protein [Mycolicibacterium]MCV7003600.1 sensor domain-containing protein [Mycolicibacterium alvei]OWM01244.1 hypothetical protein B7435_16925 [Mycolicibacterium peregrinum]BBX30443.1 sensor domain-containing protein [Mycolicibacterium alvei]